MISCITSPQRHQIRKVAGDHLQNTPRQMTNGEKTLSTTLPQNSKKEKQQLCIGDELTDIAAAIREQTRVLRELKELLRARL